MDHSALASSLALAGLRFQGLADPAAPLTPVTVAGFANAVGDEDGARAVSVSSADPRLAEKANAAWHRLADESGLFTGDGGEFLVAVDLGTGRPHVFRWARVRLGDPWDIMDAGSAGPLGAGSLLPGFVMQSTDGRVIVRGDTWESEIGAVSVRDPHRVQVLRQQAQWQADQPHRPDSDDAYQSEAARRWLDR
ncbi:hypothetical protein [Streptomyces sp. NPDC046887]|uniref:hypothetical protein n=1 Tax=Streptomyces sp. NPDC046887 TaxID=3155472 RepID=UPI00340C03C6